MVIRKACPSDYEACAALEKEIFTLHYQRRPDFFRYRDTPLTRERFGALLGTDCVFLVAEEEGEVLGHSFAGIEGYHEHPGFVDRQWLEIDDIIVRDGSRGQGIGAALLEAMKEEACRLGLDHIELTVWGFNRDALEFYKKQGMRTRIQRMEMDL